jgi:hypothetical protein
MSFVRTFGHASSGHGKRQAVDDSPRSRRNASIVHDAMRPRAANQHHHSKAPAL